MIRDRWGVKMFESHNAGECRNGMYNHTKAPIANYVYNIHATTQCGVADKKGNLLLFDDQ